MQLVIAYIAAAVTFLVLDLIWLGYVANGFYRQQMGPLLAETINQPAASAFYLMYIAGVVFFAVSPALESGGVVRAFTLGALLGLFAYGTYDLTSLAVVRGFPVQLALVDMAWGALLTATAAAVGTWVANLLHG